MREFAIKHKSQINAALWIAVTLTAITLQRYCYIAFTNLHMGKGGNPYLLHTLLCVSFVLSAISIGEFITQIRVINNIQERQDKIFSRPTIYLFKVLAVSGIIMFSDSMNLPLIKLLSIPIIISAITQPFFDN